MQGDDTDPAYKTIEFGLDVTPLLSYVEPGEAYKFFLIVDENDYENLGTGQVKYFSLIDFSNGLQEVSCDDQNVPLVDNGRTCSVTKCEWKDLLAALATEWNG